MHNCIAPEEFSEIVTHASPEDACRELVALAEKRGTDDNLSVQIVRIDRVEDVMFYRGQPIYQERELPMSNEVEVGQVLDNRFRITDLVSRSGMASIFKAQDLQSGEAGGDQDPLHAVRERSGLLLAVFSGKSRSARRCGIRSSCASCRSRRRAAPIS